MRKWILGGLGYCLLMIAATVSQMIAPPIKTAGSADGPANLATADTHMTKMEEAPDPAVAEFYRGNTVYMMIGSATGGGFDFFGRTVGKYMAKYIPGNPNIVPQNLPGAGGYNAAAKVAVNSPQDGTYIGGIHPTVIVDPVLGDPSKGAKELKFAYLGNAAPNIEGCFIRTDAPVKKFADAYTTEMVLGASNGASSTREYAALLKNVLGMKIKIVTGYPGNADIFLAIERGEVQGICGASYLNVIGSKPNWFTENFVRGLSHQGSKPIPPDVTQMAGVPPAVDFAKTPEQRAVLTLYDMQEQFGRPFVTGATVPPERIKALRAAFMKALDDPELRKEMTKRGFEIQPAPGEEIQRLVAEVYGTPPEIMKKARVAMGYE
jgi:tripartite-type tricarboxylate transporter receptor subunit TctC